MSIRRGFLRNQRGSATIEFAMASLFLFGIMLVGLDFGIYAQQNLRLGGAMQQAAVVAFNNRASSTVDTSSLGNYVSAAAGGSPTMSYQCNGGSCSGTWTSMCIGAPTTSGGWPTFAAATTSNGKPSCADGATPGNYLVMRATRTYQAVVVPDKYLGGKTMTQQVIVRLS